MKLDNPKLLSLAKAAALRKGLRRAGRKVVLTNGVFDLLHPGHLYSLKRARDEGGRKAALFVALNSDASVRALKGPMRPVQSEAERAYALASLEAVDAVIVFRGLRLTDEILALRPDIYCKSGDYTLEKLNPKERAALDAVGAKIAFTPYLAGFSTTTLVARINRAARHGDKGAAL